jgi:hypothetical protein
MGYSRINKFSIILCIIVITFIIIYNSSYKSTFKHRRSVPSIYYDGDIYSIYGSVGNPYTIYGPPQQQQIPYELYNTSITFPPPNASNFIYGPNATMLYDTMA